MVIAVMLLPALAQAIEIVTCVGEEAAAPLTFPDREGVMQYLLRRAAEKHGHTVRYVVEPRRRCVVNVQRGTYAALAVGSTSRELQETLAFPMKNGQLDLHRATQQLDTFLVTRADQPMVSWDGQALTLRDPALQIAYRSGQSAYADALVRLNISSVQVDKNERMARMLLAGHIAGMCMRAEELSALQSLPEFSGRLKTLSPPLMRVPVFTLFNRRFAAQHEPIVEQIWTTMAQLSAEAGWPEPHLPLQDTRPAK